MCSFRAGKCIVTATSENRPADRDRRLVDIDIDIIPDEHNLYRC